jgi:hypothetical protein
MSQVAMSKDQWIELFQAIGLDPETMLRWHRCFEARYPDQHQDFLEWLGIPAEEIRRIRAA